MSLKYPELTNVATRSRLAGVRSLSCTASWMFCTSKLSAYPYNKQEEGRHEQAAREETVDRARSDGIPCARQQEPYACSTTSRNTSSSDGMTRSTPSIVNPRPLRRSCSASRSTVRRAKHRVHGGPEHGRLFDFGHIFERAHHVDRTVGVNLDNRSGRRKSS